jgi:predicted dehydrogenase
MKEIMKNIKSDPMLSRRSFLKATAASSAVLALPNIVTSSALGADGRPPASERIVMGGIGIGNMGGGDLRSFMGFPEVQMVAVADVRKAHRDNAKSTVDGKYGDDGCKAYSDFRELLARKDIDAVHCATPDHWHALVVISACRAGKDVYCQKPESLTIREGRAMANAARQYGRVVSGGSQRVLDDTPDLIRQVWGGKLGKIKEVYVSCGGPSWPCNLGPAPMAEDIDWDMWLGPAPWAPYHPHRCSGTYSINGTGWRSWRDYSGGGMTDWGAHRFGGAMFAVDKRDQGPVEIIPPDGKDVKQLTYKFADGMLMYHGGGKGAIDCVGTNDPIPPKPIPGYKGRSIYGDFITCVKTRERPFRDIEFAHRTCTVCHLGNICYLLNRPLKWDPVKEIFPGDEQANRFLDRAKREPWAI